jgi:hypothetical protein
MAVKMILHALLDITNQMMRVSLIDDISLARTSIEGRA